MAKKNPIAAAAKKMAAAPVSNSTVEVKAAETKTVKAEAKAEAPKAEAKKAEEPKKETAKKAPAKRTTAKDIKTSVVVQRQQSRRYQDHRDLCKAGRERCLLCSKRYRRRRLQDRAVS